ncbi:NinE family protein [Serratia fonticola]|uniref:NinE family protein n=1 Tax=Serratia fonticola TaxID=47917 RepID=UPI001AE73035|nr:NinE family protein [Serratia fonticola]MBP0998455.1 NinE family protein [Serratia fonticola]
MSRRRKSAWDRLEERLIFKTTSRSPRKPKLTPAEIPTFNYTATLVDSMWLRRRARGMR